MKVVSNPETQKSARTKEGRTPMRVVLEHTWLRVFYLNEEATNRIASALAASSRIDCLHFLKAFFREVCAAIIVLSDLGLDSVFSSL